MFVEKGQEEIEALFGNKKRDKKGGGSSSLAARCRNEKTLIKILKAI